MAGLYGIVFALTSLLEFYLGGAAASFHGLIEVGCDGLLALEQCFLPCGSFTSQHPDFDMITATRQRTSEFPEIE